jgi:hypothetical protein
MRLDLAQLDLMKIKLLAEIGAAVAVVLSLVFVGLQLRESALQTELNTAAVQVGAYQDLMSQIGELNRLGIEDPDVARIQALGNVSLDSVSPIERRRLQAMAYFLIRHGDMAYFQYERGMLSEARMRSALSPLRAWLRYCYTQEVWAAGREDFVTGYRAYVDNIVTISPASGACRRASEEPSRTN